MGGLGMVLGGALQGVGQGMAMQVKDDLEARRATALENLRSQNESAGRIQTADLQDRNDARKTARTTDSTIVVNRTQAETQAQRDARLQGYEQANIRLRGAIDSAQASQSAQAAADATRLKAEIDGGQVKDVTAGGDGFYYKVYANGKTEKTAIPVTQKEMVGGGGGLGLEGLGPPRAAATPAPAPSAATAPKRPPVNKPPLDSFYSK